MVKNGLGHSNDQNLELAAFQEGIDVITYFLQAVTISGKLKVGWIIFGWQLSKACNFIKKDI